MINVWEVVENDSLFTMHIALSEETARYLRDWCEAIEIDIGTYEIDIGNYRNFYVHESEAFE